jgi:hypothetical protein
MARRAGGYKKSDSTEWAECARSIYGEAIVSANSIGQDVFVWMNDAILHHVYRIEQMKAAAMYQADVKHAHETKGITPQPYEAKYQVQREKPTITRPGPGQGSGPSGRSYRP